MKSNFPPSVLIRAASIAFTCPGPWARDSVRLGSELGSVGLRMVVRLDSGLVSFLNSGHKDSNRLDSRLRSVCSRSGSARGSAHRTSGLGSAHYSRFSLPRLVDLDRLGDRLEARRNSSILGSAELRARLGARFWAQLKIGWGWGLVVLGLAQGSVRLT